MASRMSMNKRVRDYIAANKLTFSSVAESSAVNIKKFSRWMTLRQSMTTDDYENVCVNGLKVDPSFFYSKKFLETKKTADSA